MYKASCYYQAPTPGPIGISGLLSMGYLTQQGHLKSPRAPNRGLEDEREINIRFALTTNICFREKTGKKQHGHNQHLPQKEEEWHMGPEDKAER